MSTLTFQTDYLATIKGGYQRFSSWLKARFWRTVETPVTTKPARLKREYEDLPSQFKTIRDLFDSLDETFKNLKVVTPKKSEFQRIIKRFGVYVLPPKIMAWIPTEDESYRLDGFKAYGLPAYIANYLPGKSKRTDINGDQFADSFYCADKRKSLPYLMCDSKKYAYYECSDVLVMDGKKTQDLAYVVAVDKHTGEVCPIRVPYIEPHTVGVGRKKDTFYTKEWRFPDYRNHGTMKNDAADKTLTNEMKVSRHIAYSFATNYSLTMSREYGVNIIVKKGKYRATFTVPQDRWKYFFKERIKAKTRTGHTKPIFHSVSAHARKTSKGTVPVKTHYRGARHFFWNGYHISIVMQGKHGVSQASFDIAGTDESDMVEGEKYLGTDEVAGRINKLFETELNH